MNQNKRKFGLGPPGRPLTSTGNNYNRRYNHHHERDPREVQVNSAGRPLTSTGYNHNRRYNHQHERDPREVQFNSAGRPLTSTGYNHYRRYNHDRERERAHAHAHDRNDNDPKKKARTMSEHSSTILPPSSTSASASAMVIVPASSSSAPLLHFSGTDDNTGNVTAAVVPAQSVQQPAAQQPAPIAQQTVQQQQPPSPPPPPDWVLRYSSARAAAQQAQQQQQEQEQQQGHASSGIAAAAAAEDAKRSQLTTVDASATSVITTPPQQITDSSMPSTTKDTNIPVLQKSVPSPAEQIDSVATHNSIKITPSSTVDYILLPDTCMRWLLKLDNKAKLNIERVFDNAGTTLLAANLILPDDPTPISIDHPCMEGNTWIDFVRAEEKVNDEDLVDRMLIYNCLLLNVFFHYRPKRTIKWIISIMDEHQKSDRRWLGVSVYPFRARTGRVNMVFKRTDTGCYVYLYNSTCTLFQTIFLPFDEGTNTTNTTVSSIPSSRGSNSHQFEIFEDINTNKSRGPKGKKSIQYNKGIYDSTYAPTDPHTNRDNVQHVNDTASKQSDKDELTTSAETTITQSKTNNGNGGEGQTNNLLPHNNDESKSNKSNWNTNTTTINTASGNGTTNSDDHTEHDDNDDAIDFSFGGSGDHDFVEQDQTSDASIGGEQGYGDMTSENDQGVSSVVSTPSKTTRWGPQVDRSSISTDDGNSNIGTGRNVDSDNNTVDDGNTNTGKNVKTIIIKSNNGLPVGTVLPPFKPVSIDGNTEDVHEFDPRRFFNESFKEPIHPKTLHNTGTHRAFMMLGGVQGVSLDHPCMSNKTLINFDNLRGNSEQIEEIGKTKKQQATWYLLLNAFLYLNPECTVKWILKRPQFRKSESIRYSINIPGFKIGNRVSMVFQNTSHGVYVVFYANNSGTRSKVSQIFFLPTGGSVDEAAVSSNILNGDTTVSGSDRRSDIARLGGNDDTSFNQGRDDSEEETDMSLTRLQIIVPQACELLIGKRVFGKFVHFGTFNLKKPIPDGEDYVYYQLALAFSKLRFYPHDRGYDTDLLRHITDLLRGLGFTTLRGIIGAILNVVNRTFYTDFEGDGKVKSLSKSKHFTETKNFQVVDDTEGVWSTKHVLSVPDKSNSIMDENRIIKDTNGKLEYVAKNIALCEDNNNFIVITFAGGQDNYNDGRDELLTWIELKERYEVELGYKVFLVHYEVDNKGRGGYRPLRSVTVSHLFGLPDPDADFLRTCWADGITVFFRRIGLKDEHGNEYPSWETLRKMKLLQAEDNASNVNVSDVKKWLLYESPIKFTLRYRPTLNSSGKQQLFAQTEKMFFFITSFRLNGAAITPLTNLHVALFCAKDRFVTDAHGTMKLEGNDGNDDDLMQQMMKDNWGEQHEYNIEWVYEIQISKTRSDAQGEKLQEMLRVSKFMECYPDAH